MRSGLNLLQTAYLHPFVTNLYPFPGTYLQWHSIKFPVPLKRTTASRDVENRISFRGPTCLKRFGWILHGDLTQVLWGGCLTLRRLIAADGGPADLTYDP